MKGSFSHDFPMLCMLTLISKRPKEASIFDSSNLLK